MRRSCRASAIKTRFRTGEKSSPLATRLEIAAGDKIRFQLRNDQLGVVNGTVATVTAVHAGHTKDPARPGAIRIEAVIDRRRISFATADIADERGRARLGWAYASTVYGAQGMTVDRAVVLLDPQFDRHAVYVAASRARDETRLVVDRSQIDALVSAKLPLDRAQQAEAASAEERRALLAGRLSNEHAKTSTIAVIQQSALPVKQADRLLSRQSADRAMQPPTSHQPRRWLPAPLRDPARAHVAASWTMAVEQKATRPPRRPATGRRRNLDKEAGWSVEFEIDRSLRVSDAEVQVLETWLGRQLDALFEGPHSSRNDIAVPDEGIKPPMRKQG